MENNEFGMEAIISNGLGFSDSLFNTKKTNFDGDFDSLSLEIASTENLVNFAETYNQLDAYNADQKIRMLKKLHVHTRNVPGKYGKSVENFIIEQSLEEAATKEATGEKSGANPSKLPNGTISKQHDGFLSKVWETLKNIFNKIVDWFKEKLQWISDKIGKRPNTSESVQILSSCTSEEAKDIWDTILETDIDASTKSSENGKVICISHNAINAFANNVEKFKAVGGSLISCAQTVEKQGGYLATNNESNFSYNNIIPQVNKIRSQIAEFIPGAKQIPETIQRLTNDDIAKFNRQFKDCLSYLKWDHDPEGYAKFFTGTNLIAKKAGTNASSIAAAQYGTTNPAELRKLIPSLTESLKTIKTTLDQLRKDVDVADKAFNKYISSKNVNIADGNGNLKNYNGEDKDNANVKVVYQFATTTMTCFKMLNKLIQVAITVHEKMNVELVKLTNVLDKAAKAKKERKWFQFKKKDRDAKKANDTLKEAGLDTENEEEVDKRNANWDKLEKFEKGAKKVGKKIDTGVNNVFDKMEKGADYISDKIDKGAEKTGKFVSQTINDIKSKRDASKAAKADAKAAKEREKADAKAAKEAAETKRQSDFSKALHEGAMAADVKDYKSSNTVKSFTDFMADRGYSDSDISKARGMLSWNPYALDSFIKQKSREDWLLNPENYI